jgi:membrane fusion protein, peptide pheromone/bacteriocin exporter
MNFSSDPINNLENLIAKNKAKSFSIYLVVVFAVLTLLFLLPVIKIDISSQSQGIIRSKTDNVPIATIVSGRITWMALKNNEIVEKGDTLIKISKESLTAEKNTQTKLSSSTSELLMDLNRLLKGNSTSLKQLLRAKIFINFKAAN